MLEVLIRGPHVSIVFFELRGFRFHISGFGLFRVRSLLPSRRAFSLRPTGGRQQLYVILPLDSELPYASLQVGLLEVNSETLK